MLRTLVIGTLLGTFFPASLGAPTYDEEEAKHFASLSSITYCDDVSQLEKWTCTGCVNSKTRLVPGKVRVVDSGRFNQSRAVIGKLKDEPGCIVAFRGTDNPMNWLDNLDAFHTSPNGFDVCKGCKVHGGFYSIWKDMSVLVNHALDELGCEPGTPDGQNIYVSGHSLGGALAQLEAFHLMQGGLNVTKLYTFETPRLGNKVFADTFAKVFANVPVFRISHHRDPVVHLPPRFLGYQHMHTEVYYDGKGNYKVCDGSGKDPTCAHQFSNAFKNLKHASEHCGTPLLPNKNFCWPVGCLKKHLTEEKHLGEEAAVVPSFSESVVMV